MKGVVNQEEQQEIKYPGVLHCVFCGAKGLFMDSLIKSTSAHIVVRAQQQAGFTVLVTIERHLLHLCLPTTLVL